MIFIIQRHGKADKAATDMDRQLSEAGRQQAEAMQQILFESRLSGADVVLASTAPRAIDTVKLDGAVTALPELYMPKGEDGAEMDRLFGRFGYAPYRAYRDADEKGVFARWTAAAVAAVREHSNGARFVRIGCHAILSNALALGLLPEEEAEARNMLLDAALDEAECIVIELASSARGNLAELGYEIATSAVTVRILGPNVA